MVYKFAVNTNQPAFVDVTDRLEKAVAQSSVSTGLCLVTVSDPCAAIAFVEGSNEGAKADILNELNIALPPRVDYQSGSEPRISTAKTKAALVGGSKEIPVLDGKLQLASGRSVCVLDFAGSKTIEVNIKCL